MLQLSLTVMFSRSLAKARGWQGQGPVLGGAQGVSVFSLGTVGLEISLP